MPSLTRFITFGSLRWGTMALSLAASAWAQVDRTAAATALSPRLAERRAVVEGLTVPLQNLKVTDMAGRDLSNEVQPRNERGAVTMNLAINAPIVLKPREIGTVVLKDNARLVLPGGVIMPSPNGAPADKPVWFRLTLTPSPAPAPWDPLLRSYVTRLTFGLQRPAGAPSSLTLDQPVMVKVDYQGLSAAEPTSVVIEAPGLENEKTVELRFTPLTAAPTLLVRSSISDVNLQLTALPRLEVQPARDTMLGFGLDQMNVTVARVSPDGRNQPVTASTPLVVEVTGRAQTEGGPFVLNPGEASTQLALRSAGLGPVTIRATSDGVSGAVTVQQRFPTGPLVAVLIGGALGGYARRFVKGARRSLIGRRIAEGVVVATIAFVAGVLGVGHLNLPAAIVATEAGAFLTGALAAFAGVTVLETLTKKKTASD